LTLTYLDELADRIAVIGTSNVKLGDMDERFHSRFQQFHVKPPETKSIATLLKRFNLAAKNINEITLGCGGARAALLGSIHPRHPTHLTASLTRSGPPPGRSAPLGREE